MRLQDVPKGLASVLLGSSALLWGTAPQAVTPDTNPRYDQAPTATTFIQGTDKTITYRIIDGHAIFNGDIALGRHEEVQASGAPPLKVEAFTREFEDQTGTVQSAAVSRATRWSNGIVPIRFDGGFGQSSREVVWEAIRRLEAKTSVDFVEYSGQSNYLNIFSGSGCWSYVGMNGGQQWLSLGRGCVYVGVVQHELLHALGLWHEQSRQDRDQYVTINWNNIRSGMESQFYTQDELGYGPYDYGSVMHYGRYAFSKDWGRLETITPKDPDVEIGNRSGVSDLDVNAINWMYPGDDDDGDSNEAPRIELSAQSGRIFDDQSFELDVAVGDDRTDADRLRLAAESDNTALLPNGNITVDAGQGTDERIVTMTPVRGQSGTANVTLSVSDEQGETSSKVFELLVELNDNEPPTINLRGDSAEIDSGQSYDLVMEVLDDRTTTPNMRIRLTSSNQQLLPDSNIRLDTNNAPILVAVLSPVAGESGETTVEIEATDEQGRSATASFHLTVNGGDDGGDPVEEGVYTLTAMHSDKCMDVAYGSQNNGERVIQWTCHGNQNQQWRLTTAGAENLFFLQAVHSGQCLDVHGGSRTAGHYFIQWPCHGGENQQFLVEATGDGAYRLTVQHSDMAVAVENGTTDNFGYVVQMPMDESDNSQQWLLNKVR